MKANEVREKARGRWLEILGALAPDLDQALARSGRHVPCPVHGGKDGLRIFKDAAETGGSVCNTCGVHADGFATLMWIKDWSFTTTLREVSTYLSMGARDRDRNAHPETRYRGDEQGEPDEACDRARQSLNRVWGESIGLTHRDAEPARLYLARRGISINPPDTLRFHRALPYYDGEKRLGEFPAILAMMTDVNGNALTIHRTYLSETGQKAAVEAPKKLMSIPSDRKLVGGGVRLSPAEGRTIAVAEGIETALAVLEATGIPTWAAVNAYLLEHFSPPPNTEQVLVFADKDRATEQHPSGHGQEAAKALVQRLWTVGIKAGAIVPSGEIPNGHKSVDWLDVLNQKGREGFPALQSVERATRRVRTA